MDTHRQMPMINRNDIDSLLRDRLTRVGFALQCSAGLLLGVVFIAIRMRWIDIVEIGLRGGIDTRSVELDILSWGIRLLAIAFGTGFVLYAVAFERLRRIRTS